MLLWQHTMCYEGHLPGTLQWTLENITHTEGVREGGREGIQTVEVLWQT